MNNFKVVTTKIAILCLVLFVTAVCGKMQKTFAQGQDHILTTGPIDADAAGKGGETALASVLRLVCRETNSAGTGFVHKSGLILTAAHVVRGCTAPVGLTPTGEVVGLRTQAADDERDLALLVPLKRITTAALPISSTPDIKIGTRVATWGFPGGYRGRAALLSVGYLSGVDTLRLPSGHVITQFVVNAAFNSGNSGGPLLNVGSGEVLGVVSSKLAPLPEEVSRILDVLSKKQNGIQYSSRLPDGTIRSFSEAQIVGAVLDELRKQVQLVIGYAVITSDLRSFLMENGVAP